MCRQRGVEGCGNDSSMLVSGTFQHLPPTSDRRRPPPPPALAGSGQHTKMVNQILIASNMIGVCEGLLYAHR